jgi:hypothetical protein
LQNTLMTKMKNNGDIKMLNTENQAPVDIRVKCNHCGRSAYDALSFSQARNGFNHYLCKSKKCPYNEEVTNFMYITPLDPTGWN